MCQQSSPGIFSKIGLAENNPKCVLSSITLMQRQKGKHNLDNTFTGTTTLSELKSSAQTDQSLYRDKGVRLGKVGCHE